MAAEAHTMCLVLFNYMEKGVYENAHIPNWSDCCGGKWGKGLYCMLNKMSKLNVHKYLQKANSSVLQQTTSTEISVAPA